MVSQANKRQPRQPLSPEEVKEFIRLKKLRQFIKTENFKKTKSYKYMNIFNITCIIIYSELVFSFMGSCHYQTHTIHSLASYYGDEIIGGKRSISSLVIKTEDNKEYDIGVRDTCTLPLVNSEFLVGEDWILQKEIKVKFSETGKKFYIRQAFPLLFISLLLGTVTFVLFGYNLNQAPYSLNVISFINLLSISYFLMI